MSIFTENLQGKDLTAADKYIYLFLVNNFSEAGACDLPNEKLCELLEVSLSTFRKSIKTLQEKKLVKIQRFPNKRVLKFTTLVKNTTLVIFTTPIKIYYPTESIKNLNKSESYLVSWADFSIKIWELERKEAKERYIYINTYINSININIISIEGKSSLTSFASTSLKYYIGKFNFVNDPDHKELNSVHNSLTPTEPANNSLAEVLKAPAKQKKTKKAKAPFQPPTYDMVLGFMAAYVHQEQSNFPELIEINLNIEAKKYMNFYSGKDWRLGVIRMTDWRIQASNWLMSKVERITEGKIKIKKNQQYIQEAFGDSFLNAPNIVDLNQVQNADGTITAETPAIQTSFPIFQQTKTKEQLKKETDDFIQKHKSGEVL